MHKLLAISAVIGTLMAGQSLLTSVAAAAEGGPVKDREWGFQGVFGTYDRDALRRGFQVYTEACSSCHSLRLLAYRNLQNIGFSEEQVKAAAAAFEVTDGPNDEGEMFKRPALPSDRFVSPFANDKAARAGNNGALPPDLSLIVKARKNGANYLHALLTGYAEAPTGFTLSEGMNFNPVFPGGQIAMARPLDNEAVEYADGTKPTLDQHATDVVTFLAWAASPELEARKSLGVSTLIFLFVLTGLLYALKRRIWADLH